MKRITIILAMLVIAVVALAQDGQTQKNKEDGDKPPRQMKTLFGNSGIRSNGGYGALLSGYTQIDGLDALTVGAKGAWVINHQIGIGLAGYGFVSERRADASLDGNYRFAGGYGGFMFELIALPNSPIHLSFPLTVGAGGISYVRDNNFFNDFDRSPFSEDTQVFFVVEPGIDLEMNLVRFMRLGIGVSYRYTSDVNLSYLDNGQAIAGKGLLKGLSGGITLKFGKF